MMTVDKNELRFTPIRAEPWYKIRKCHVWYYTFPREYVVYRKRIVKVPRYRVAGRVWVN